MSIKIHIPKHMRTETEKKDVVEVDGGTIRECLNDLERRYPGLKGTFFNRFNRLKNYIKIDVNVIRNLLELVENPYPDDKTVVDGDELYIHVAV